MEKVSNITLRTFWGRLGRKTRHLDFFIFNIETLHPSSV